ncbi:ribosomal L1 domain-containing protein 1-like [Camellia sinensis]|uniref:ribosomal L1 domain-containing protein 1-like n=1 Tax=Camellia sinensis TaxID=4442 RepID=UPI001035DE71|nr:ribosomal L1 domain-containing protein 1-like [Camellia sinensis]
MAELQNSSLHPPPSSLSRVSTETVQKAVKALLKWRTSQSKTQKPQLFDQDDDFIYLILSLKKIPPKSRTNAYKIPLPHSLRSNSVSSEFCLIIDDRPKNSSKLTSESAKKKINSEDIPITKVLKLSKLKSDYKPFEAKRKLCDSFEMFFADRRIIPLLPKLLGKQFFKRKKIPVPVDLSHMNWKEQIEKACSSALLYLRTGTCSVVRIGKASMESGEIVENVIAAIDGVVEVSPKKWAGVRSFHLKFSDSVALPIYQTLPDMKLKIEGKKEFDEGVRKEFDEGVRKEFDEGVKEESKEDEKLGKKKGGLKKKGRIHEVRYMDSELEGALGNEDDEEYIGSEKSEHDGEGGDELGGKKRKKGDALNGGMVSTKLNGEKRSKKSATKVERAEESVQKKVKKGGVGKLKDGARKVKDKKSKKQLSAQ